MRIALLGDIALIGQYDRTISDNVNQRVYCVKQLVHDCDYVIANLESPFTNISKTRACKGVYLKSDTANVETLRYIGVTHVTLANNHLYDYGRQGALDTIRTLKRAGIKYVGLNNNPAILKKGDSIVALDGFCCLSANALNYGTHRGQVKLLSPATLEEFLSVAKEKNWLPIVSAHFGIEGIHYPSKEHMSLFEDMGNRYSYVLHGNHPHAIQGCIKYRDSLFVYAQGDLCFDVTPVTSMHLNTSEESVICNSYITVIEIEHNEVQSYRNIPVTDDGVGYIRENIEGLKELNQYCEALELPSEEIFELRRLELLDQKEKAQQRDLRFFLNRLNFRYIGAYLNGINHSKRYTKLMERYVNLNKDIQLSNDQISMHLNTKKSGPLRVLCVMSTLDRGGAESMVMSFFRKIDREKVIFDFVKHTNKKCAFEDEIESLGGVIYEAPRYKGYNHISYIAWWKTFFKQHPEYRIIHGHYFTISAVYFSEAHKANRITIGHSHCTEAPREQISKPFMHLIENAYISQIEHHSDYCMACSVVAGKWLFKKKPFRVLNNAIDANLFKANADIGNQVRKEFGLDSSFVVGNVSRFNLQKNPYGTLQIFKLIHDRNQNSKLLWIGDGPMRNEVNDKAKEEGIAENIIFTGVRGDVYKLLQAMDAFILPSYYEGLPVAAIEAQAAGVPTFCSSAITREVGITDNCSFLPIDDLSVWATEISKLSANSIHYNTTEQIVAAGYDISTAASQLQEFYLNINRID